MVLTAARAQREGTGQAGAPGSRARPRPGRNRALVLKLTFWALGLLPIPLGLYRLFFGDGFGVNPIQELEHYTGDVTLISLLVVLSVTPLRRLTGWNDIQKVRRLLGLFAFFYVSVHFAMWFAVDQFFAWEYIGEDITERPFILVGFTAFVLLVPLAVTSTKGWIRRLGRNWTRIHRLVYLATLLGIVHFFWVTKADDRWPTFALVCWGVLMTLRLIFAQRGSRSARAPVRQQAVSEAA